MNRSFSAGRKAGLVVQGLAGCALALVVGAGSSQPTGERNAQPSVPILLYHQIRTCPDGPADGPIAMSLERFEEQMRYLHEHGYTTLSTEQVVAFVRGGGVPSGKLVVIHFDDGWKSSLAAVPILDRYGYRATFWIIAGTGIGWPHMEWDEVLKLAAHPGFEIQSHTWSHPWKDGETLVDWMAGRTPGKGVAQARSELTDSRKLLEDKLRRPIVYLAWPRGLYNDGLIRLAQQAGYHALFTTDDGTNHRGDDPLRLRRTTIDGACDLHSFEQILADGVYRECSSGAADGSRH
jgi:peptidoglycan/xylan/chitin deacetylase (PgdA/CDA1 family)